MSIDTDLRTGNLVFFQSYGTSPWDQFMSRTVQCFTRGPYVHVAIVVDEDRTILAATTTGITYGKLPVDPTTYQMVDIKTRNQDEQHHAAPLSQWRINKAILWAEHLVGTPYGWLDIVDQGLNLVAPWNKLRLSEANHYDCSNLACEFLDRAGVWMPETFGYPYNVNPNDLAEWFGLLPNRRRIRRNS